jgi:NTE family protein
MNHQTTDAELNDGPVRRIPGDPAQPQLQNEIALCLSGNGYRAMLYHVGSL